MVFSGGAGLQPPRSRPAWPGTSQTELTRAEIDKILARAGTATDFYIYATPANNVTDKHDWCSYPGRWIKLDPYGANELDFYAAPTSNIANLFQQDGTPITLANFTAATTNATFNTAYAVGNFSALVGINAYAVLNVA